MSRAWMALGLGVWACTGESEPDCEATDCSDADTDVPADPTDPTTDATDPVTDPPAPQVALLRYRFTVETWPNQLVASVVCDGVELTRREDFLVAGQEVQIEVEAEAGQACVLYMGDGEGGRIPAGEAFVCDAPAAKWEASKGYGPLAMAEVTAALCTSGCADPIAENPTPGANLDDGSCVYIDGCMSSEASNFDPAATRDDGSCRYTTFGVVTVNFDFDPWPNESGLEITCDGAVIYTRVGFSTTEDTISLPVDPGRECVVEVTDTLADRSAGGTLLFCGQVIDTWGQGLLLGTNREEVGRFTTWSCSGCTDPSAGNFDADAFADDGTCVYP